MKISSRYCCRGRMHIVGDGMHKSYVGKQPLDGRGSGFDFGYSFDSGDGMGDGLWFAEGDTEDRCCGHLFGYALTPGYELGCGYGRDLDDVLV